MGRGVTGAILKLMRAKDYELTLLETGWLSPTMRRLKFSAPTLFAEVPMKNGEFLRFWFPEPGSSPEKPSKTFYQRGYTLMNVDPEAGTFDVYVLIHQPAGPASSWSLTAEPGATLEATRLGSAPFAIPEETTGGVVFFADAASLPYAHACVEEIPAEREAIVVIQLYHESDRDIPLVAEIASRPNVTVEWIDPSPATLDAWLASHDLTGWNAHVVPEVKVAHQIRKHLKKIGTPKQLVHAHAYWVKGKAMGTARAAGATGGATSETEN